MDNNDLIEHNDQVGDFGIDEGSIHEIEGGQVSSKKRKPSCRSSVWDHLTRVNNEKATCNYCSKVLSAGSSKGTSHLKRHLDSCKSKPKFGNVANMLIDHKGKLRGQKIDQKIWREKVAKMIIRHELPFSFVEYEGFREVVRYLSLDVKMISRNTIAGDVYKFFEAEKEKLKIELANVRSRICLTSNLWTSIKHEGYICVTGHYVGEDWKLNSKILSFCSMPPPHNGMEIARKKYDCLKDWGIERKIFSITVDNATSNDCMQVILKNQFCLQRGLLCKGEFFHIRCSAHILNLIVQDGLKVIGESLDKIRESVKYVRASEIRMRAFDECVEKVGKESGASLYLDVTTRWNSTYTMLHNALKYQYAFSTFQLIDMNYKYCPSNDEWESGEKIHDFLEPFDEITKLISGTNYLTSNLYFMKVWKIEMLLNSYENNEDEVVKSMAIKMKAKFDKYWDHYSIILAMGAVLDPRMKFKALKYCYDQIDKNTSETHLERVRYKLYTLFEEYKNAFAVRTSKDTSLQERPKESGQRSRLFHDIYGCDEEDSSGYGSRSALEKYLTDPKLNMQRYEDMDVLEF